MNHRWWSVWSRWKYRSCSARTATLKSPNPAIWTLPAFISRWKARQQLDFSEMLPFRIGQGWDVHRIETGRPLMLGGVQIPSEFGLVGHSDADVLFHAVTDAILGALALGDIGMHFPDTAPEWKGANSLQFLQHAVKLARDK